MRVVVPSAFGGLDAYGPGGFGPQAWPHDDPFMQFDQFSRELVANAGAFEWASDDYTEALAHVKPGMTWHVVA